MRRGKDRTVFVTMVAIVMATMVTSCFFASRYPPILTQADSLLMRGDYKAVDSLLASYDHAADAIDDASCHYRRLLDMGRRFVDEELSDSDFSIVDSLCRYYDHWNTQDKYGKALCFLGEIYRVSGDYPSALNAFLKATNIAEKCGDSYLLGWLCQRQGDVYFDQRMLDECIAYYRKYYHIAVCHQDTLRMALGAFRMGRVYTIDNKIDSIIFYYQKAIHLSGHTAHPENVEPYARYQLADIYIQIEEYDKAVALMPRDSLNDANWAYWHLGQNHTDSAIYYLEKIQNRYGLSTRVADYRMLAQLEESKGDIQKAQSYYKALPAMEDSLKLETQVAETRRINAQYNLNLVKAERDEIAHHSRLMELTLLAVFVLLAFVVILVFYVWKYYRQKKNAELIHEKLLRKEKEDKYKQSICQLNENRQRMAELEKQLAEAQNHHDEDTADRIKLDAQLLAAENQSIYAFQQRREFMLNKLQESALYLRIKFQAGKESFHLKDEEWQQIGRGIDDVYDNFTNRLLTLVELSDLELKVCYLVKLGVAPSAIALMLYKTKAAITMLRQRLYEKITHQKGTAKQLDEFILSF